MRAPATTKTVLAPVGTVQKRLKTKATKRKKWRMAET